MTFQFLFCVVTDMNRDERLNTTKPNDPKAERL